MTSSEGRLWTVRDVLTWTAGRLERAEIESARLDAEVLLAHALGCDRVGLYLDFDRPLSASERGRYRVLITRRLQREPVAYLVGEKEFYSRSFVVDPRVLIPRPETETLVERALTLLEGREGPRILDVGTGSGAIACTLAAERPDALVVATERSAAALLVAEANAARLGVRVRFLEGDLLAPLEPDERFDLVAANLPYIARSERHRLAPELHFEPESALFSDGDALAMVSALIAQAPGCLERPGGMMLLEVGAGQRTAVDALLTAGGYRAIDWTQDLGGHDRIVSARAA